MDDVRAGVAQFDGHVSETLLVVLIESFRVIVVEVRGFRDGLVWWVEVDEVACFDLVEDVFEAFVVNCRVLEDLVGGPDCVGANPVGIGVIAYGNVELTALVLAVQAVESGPIEIEEETRPADCLFRDLVCSVA